MTPEIGTFCIILAFCFAMMQTVYPERKMVMGQAACLCISMICLILSFLSNDMSVQYVIEHSHTSLPILYRIGAAWGGHEGSLLLWCLILSGWSFAFALFYPHFDKNGTSIYTKNISILGLLSSGFIAFLLFTSNPFKRVFPTAPISGDDLTPILQDPGLIFHPPMLYMGYVGFAIAFAFAISALIEGKFEKSWAKHARPWIILPWAFLSCGIVLGSWWAYRELGWGGWWFWDPVENASLLPWLSATALIHALIVTEKRDAFKGWTILLSIVTFALSLLGTFLVRSGVLVSVHAFASDPLRGIFLLAYLTFIIGGALSYYAYRIKAFYRPPLFSLFSRETLLLVNSVLLLTAVATITLGTLYPIVLDALGIGKISVGEPYFNTVFIPLMLPLLFLMGFAPHTHWKHHASTGLFKKISLTLVLSILFAIFFPFLFGFTFKILTTIGLAFGFWLILSTLHYGFKGGKNWPMIIAHLGIGVLALGIIVNKSYSEERQVKIQPGETISLAGNDFTFYHLAKIAGPNYTATTASFSVQKALHTPKLLQAEQRTYVSHEQTLTKPGILTNIWRDLYLAMGNTLPDGSWSIRIYYKPFVRFIWLGGLMLLVGGLVSLLSYLKKSRETA